MIQKIEAQLRAHPDDLDTLLIYADALLEQGDPRGEVIALQHAIAVETDSSATVRLDKSLRDLIAKNRSTVLGKPGGFPYRDAWWGRGYMTVDARAEHPAHFPDLYDRIVRLLSSRTDASGPTTVTYQLRTGYPGAHQAIRAALGPGYEEWSHGQWTRKPGLVMDLHAAIQPSLVAAYNAMEGLQPTLGLSYDFQLRFADATDVLPYQAGTYYSDGVNRRSRLTITTNGDLVEWRVTLQAPIEGPTDEFAELQEYTLEVLSMENPRVRVFQFTPRPNRTSFQRVQLEGPPP